MRLFLCLFSILTLALPAQAKSPVVVEMFGLNGCGEDVKAQDIVFSMLRDYDDVVFINCRKRWDDPNAELKYTHDFCNERSAEYARRFSFWGERTPMVVVNGKWEAFYDDIGPSIKVGAADKVKTIDLRVEDDGLHISVPAIEGVEKGALFLYSYAPTQGDETLVVDPDVSLTDDIQKRLAAGQSVPFVTKERLVPYYVRPIVNRYRVGSWNGGVFEATFPLSSLVGMDRSMISELSYVAILHEGDDYGPILAAGEVMSPVEMNNIFLNSKAPNIEMRSNPNPEMLQSQ